MLPNFFIVRLLKQDVSLGMADAIQLESQHVGPSWTLNVDLTAEGIMELPKIKVSDIVDTRLS